MVEEVWGKHPHQPVFGRVGGVCEQYLGSTSPGDDTISPDCLDSEGVEWPRHKCGPGPLSSHNHIH